jgi:hypothetical protein
MRKMVINSKFKYFGRITEKEYCPVIANRGASVFFEDRNNNNIIIIIITNL